MKITLEEANNLRKRREELSWEMWFCPVGGGFGCAGPACPLFTITDSYSYEAKGPMAFVNCNFPDKNYPEPTV